MNDLDARLKTVFRTCFQLQVEDAEIATASRGNCPAWDSMHHLNFVLVTEQTFDISIPDEKAADIASYADMLLLVQALVSQKECSSSPCPLEKES
jgi:acyl carrier protein